MSKTLREQIAQFCHDNDFTTGMAEKPYVAESWDTAPKEVRESYLRDAKAILTIVKKYHKEFPER